MSDVGALVLTLGEPETERALASVRSQSLPMAEVVVLEGVRPFHRAFNTGAARMTTPYVLQVDADFILDRDCARTLRAAMSPGVGIAVAALRDPLIGRVAGVKLFRRECFDLARLRDTLAPDVDFYRRLGVDGWHTRYVIPRGTPTLGAHHPHYTLEYTFGTYYLLGAGYASYNDILGLLWRSTQLRRSLHEMAVVARMALGHGVFAAETGNVAKPLPATETADFLRELVDGADPGSNGTDAELRRVVAALASLPAQELLRESVELGVALRSRADRAFGRMLSALTELDAARAWITEAGLAHGALSGALSAIPTPAMTTLDKMLSSPLAALFPRRA